MNLTQQQPKTSASAVTCSDEIQQKNLKRVLIYSFAPKISDKMHHKTLKYPPPQSRAHIINAA